MEIQAPRTSCFQRGLRSWTIQLCYGYYVILGDHTKLPVLGRGSAAICINGKNIKVRNALCVPDLRDALYSLRRHNHMPGCGTFSHHDVGSFILFPDFMLQVDDSHDYLVSYKPVKNPHEV